MPLLSTFGAVSARGFGRGRALQRFTISSNQQELNLETYLTGEGWRGTAIVEVTIGSGVYIWSDDTATAGLTISQALSDRLIIINNGYIIGRGGNGGNSGSEFTNPTDPTAGGPAVSNSASGVILHNYSGAFIAGGGGGGGSFRWGGGGGGAGGGKGGDSGPRHVTLSGGSGGAIGQSGADGASWGSPYIDFNYSGSDGGSGDPRGFGGGAGGGGGTSIDTGSSDNVYMGTGGGGGRILPGTGGNGGNRDGYLRAAGREGGDGGSAGNVGGNGTNAYGKEDGAGGGGGWGAAGGNAVGQLAKNGAAGGAAISGTPITVTNNGTIYGSQA